MKLFRNWLRRRSHPPPALAGGARAVKLRVRQVRRLRERGVALVMVLSSLALIAVMLTEFQDETSADFGHALAERDALKAEYAAKSGINLTRLLIASEPTVRKSVMLMFRGKAPQIPVWEYAPQVLGVFNDADGASRFKTLGSFDLKEGKNLGLEGAGFELTIVDEDSKFNVNQAARPSPFAQQRMAQQLMGLMQGIQFDPLFDGADADGNRNSREQICGAIIDWTDPDQNAEVCDLSGQQAAVGAEDSFYQLLDDAYERKNAAFDSLEELHLVRGITDDFWTTFIHPDPGDPTSRLATVWAAGKVNINTANPQTLHALICGAALPDQPFCVEPEQIGNFLMLASMLKGATAGVPLFTSPNSLLNALKGKGMVGAVMKSFDLEPPKLISESELKKTLTTESKVFSIYATGIATAGKRRTMRRIHAVVDFRGAPKPLDFSKVSVDDAAGDSDSTPLGQAVNLVNPAKLPQGATPDALVGAFRPSPGGRVIYYRIE